MATLRGICDAPRKTSTRKSFNPRPKEREFVLPLYEEVIIRQGSSEFRALSAGRFVPCSTAVARTSQGTLGEPEVTVFC